MHQVIEHARMGEVNPDGCMSRADIIAQSELANDMVISESGLAGKVTAEFDPATLRTVFRGDLEYLRILVMWDAPDIHFGEITPL